MTGKARQSTRPSNSSRGHGPQRTVSQSGTSIMVATAQGARNNVRSRLRALQQCCCNQSKGATEGHRNGYLKRHLHRLLSFPPSPHTHAKLFCVSESSRGFGIPLARCTGMDNVKANQDFIPGKSEVCRISSLSGTCFCKSYEVPKSGRRL
jgi:hypothetical protein